MANAQHWQQRAAFYAQKYGIPASVFLRQIRQESGFNPNAHSPAGAQGIAQIMPFHNVGTNPERQLDWAAREDASNFSKYHNWQDALSIYNSGRPFAQGKNISETRNYVHSILSGANQMAHAATGAGAAAMGHMAGSTPGIDPNQLRKLGAAYFLERAQAIQQGNPDDGLLGLAMARRALMSSGNLGRSAPQSNPGGAHMPSGGHIGGLKELLMEGTGGPTHSTGPHVHVASLNPKTMLAAIQMAKRMGLAVGSNDYVGSPPTPGVHAPHSYHYVNLGKYNGRELNAAIDVSGNPAAMRRYYSALGGR